jgi:hypothetical protein
MQEKGAHLDVGNNEIPDPTIVDQIVVLAEGDDRCGKTHREYGDQANTECFCDANVPYKPHGDDDQDGVPNNVGWEHTKSILRERNVGTVAY